MRLVALAVLAIMMALPAVAQADNGGLVFECLFQDVDAPVEDASVQQHRLAVLGDFLPDDAFNSPVVRVFDPQNLLEGESLEKFALARDQKRSDSFNWIFRSKHDSARSVLMVVAPSGDPREATEKNELIGSLGFEDEPGPRWVASCRILSGQQGVDYFEELSSREVQVQ